MPVCAGGRVRAYTRARSRRIRPPRHRARARTLTAAFSGSARAVRSELRRMCDESSSELEASTRTLRVA
eukprot:658997-Pleurochrysis_carterae.AAC.1